MKRTQIFTGLIALTQVVRIPKWRNRRNKMKMMIVLMVCCVFGLPEISKAAVIDFDDIATESFFGIPDGYGGLNWDGEFNAISSSHSGGVFSHGIVSESYVAACGSAVEGIVSHPTLTFDFESVYMTGGWYGLDVVTEGYLGGTLMHTKTNTIVTSGPIKFDFNWTGIDTLVFAPSNGAGANRDILLDDLSIQIVPEPTTVLLMVFGGLVMRRRRNRGK
jgi:hypothetical protein